MKKKFFYAVALLCAAAVITACGESPVDPVTPPVNPPTEKPTEKPETPPTANDILATYSGDKLVLTVDGGEAGTDPKVEISKGDSESLVDMDLYNIIPGIPEYTLDDVKFESATKSIYYSKLSGSVDDNLAGWKIKVEGTVDGGILTLGVKLEKIEGTPITNASDLFSTYKGDMQIALGGATVGEDIEQRVYVSEAKENKNSSIKLSIRDFSFSGMDIGTIEFDNIPVTQRGDVYGFEAADRELTVNIAGQDLTLVAKVFGVIHEGDIMYLNVDLVGGGLVINVLFDGVSVQESTDAQITGYAFENGSAIAEQKSEGKSTTLYIWDDTEASKLLITPKPELSAGASIVKVEGYYNSATNELEEGKPIDFSLFKDGEYIRYTVQAEDPSVTATYLVYINWLKSIPLSYDFTGMNWNSNGESYPMNYDEPEGWSTSNSATSLLKIFNDENENPLCPWDLAPVSKNTDNAAKIITIDTKGVDKGFAVVPAVTAGTLFLGTFEISLENTLKSTKFGVPFKQKPVGFSGQYKYAPGATYYKTVITETADGKVVSKEEVADKSDLCSINAVLYEVADYSETLDGTNVMDSKNIVAVAMLQDGSAKADWTSFDVNFTYMKQYDSSKKYKLAVICSSSAEGNSFEGAPESELVIKSINIKVEE